MCIRVHQFFFVTFMCVCLFFVTAISFLMLLVDASSHFTPMIIRLKQFPVAANSTAHILSASLYSSNSQQQQQQANSIVQVSPERSGINPPTCTDGSPPPLDLKHANWDFILKGKPLPLLLTHAIYHHPWLAEWDYSSQVRFLVVLHLQGALLPIHAALVFFCVAALSIRFPSVDHMCASSLYYTGASFTSSSITTCKCS